jgi:hypothetical protein
MRKLLYIMTLFLAVACVNGPLEEGNTIPTGDPKVEIDFTVQVKDPSVATRALGQQPTLRNLMVAVFDASGYLLEYTFATEINLATENATHYAYKVAITQSAEPRIIHFIGNAPEKLTFGVEETVLAEITSSIGVNPDDGIYWCRRELPQISGTNSGGSMALLDDDAMEVASPIYQADLQTRAYFSNVGLIRNFSQIQLFSSSSDFTLEKYYVVGTPKEGLAAAYNYSTGKFVNYYKGNTVTENGPAGFAFNLGEAKTFEEIIAEGYDANVLPAAEKFTLSESSVESNWVANGASAFVYECEKPLRAEDAAYIIAYGKYKDDGKNYYYKIDLRDENGYFPIIRNFKYTIDITQVTRPGYETIEKAATSAGSGDISTSLETKSLAYISDGVASLEVDYIEKYIVAPGDVTLGYKFLDDVKTSHAGDPSKMWIVVNEAGATGAAIAAINGNAYTAGQNITVSQNPGTLTITPTGLTDVPKSQTLTIFAEYVHDNASHILQRTVNFIVQSKRTMLVSLAPSEVPNEAGSEFDVKISLPAGLSKSIFPLEFLIESGALSINPHNDQMPVRSGFSLVDNTKSSLYFVKTFDYEDYNPESGAVNIVDCHFKTIRAQAETHIYAANPYFITEYDYQGTVSNLDADGESVYLDTYAPSKFTRLSFSADPVGAGESQPVNFSFDMDRIPEDGVVRVALGNLMPASDETQLEYIGNEGTKAIFEFRPSRNSGTFKLLTAQFWEDLSVDLSAYKFTPASESAGRSLFNFSGMFSKDYLSGTAEAVSYTFFVPQYYEDMYIEVELRGLKFNENNLPANWSDWRDMGGGLYAVRYTPSGPLGSVTMNLVTAITTTSETCTVTLQAKGYNNHTSTIEVLRNITIPNGKLIMNLPNNTTTFQNSTSNAQDRRIYIYKADGNTLLGNYSYDRGNNSRRATNNMAITLNNVTSGTSIYVTYTRGGVTYKSPNFTISDAIDNNGVTQTLTRQ